jgi:hypothetical protein
MKTHRNFDVGWAEQVSKFNIGLLVFGLGFERIKFRIWILIIFFSF